MILGPGTPMLFQGQEFVSSKPFNYFANHNPELADMVCKGRIEFLAQFRSITAAPETGCVPDPGRTNTFENCKLDHDEKERNKHWLLFHKELLSLKKNDRGFNGKELTHIDGAVLSDHSFIIRYFLTDGLDRIMLVNLGVDLNYNPAPEPLIAPPENMNWELLWSSEDPKYGANGIPDFPENSNWIIPGHSTTIFKPVSKGG
jgi:maltooligosyltrehalose trehalohydrolase